ncbi:MAG: sugar-transfer associated ATP-grasp domain-containing protein, partial [Gammaproteobacteria bacterium]
LMLEVTETALLSDTSAALEELEALRRLGVQLVTRDGGGEVGVRGRDVARVEGAAAGVERAPRREDGVVRPVAAILKICAGDNETDNFHQGMNGNLVASIDLATGRLSKGVSSASREFPLMRSYSNHPDNQHPIEGFQLPDWADLLALAERGHREFSEFWTLGWDVALTDRGPVLIEANPIWATGFLQAAAGKGMRGEFDRWKARLEKGVARGAPTQGRAEEVRP